MGMMKNYLLKLLEQCSEEQFGQDAIEWAITSGLVPLSYDLDRDVHNVMSRYDELIEAYRRSPAKATATPRTLPAPMKRAQPRSPARSSGSKTATGRRKAA